MATEITTAGEFTPQDQLLARLDSLEQALLSADPQLPGHLKAIHQQLHQQSELLHLLKPEQIGPIMAAMQKLTGIKLVQEAVKAPSKGRAPKISASDIL
jgi:hypothetical protein